ncbi:hypothetical protein G6F68_020287 [Rhizopus microsporus]|nr:hypothetical protein G6F68_020287 [Rhizopus microsporus]
MRHRHFGQAAHQQQRDQPADGVADDHAGAGESDGELAAQEQAGADGPADGDHAHLARGQAALEPLFTFGDFAEPLLLPHWLLLVLRSLYGCKAGLACAIRQRFVAFKSRWTVA